MTVSNEITETRPLPAGHYHSTGAIRSEWIKLRTVRSTVWTLGALIFLTIGIGVLVTHADASNWAHLSLADRLQFDPTNDSLAGLVVGQLAIGVLGILVITAEHGTGSIRATLSAVPNRPLVLGAKAVVFGLVALIVGEAVCVVSFLAGQAMISGKAPQATLGQPGVARAVLLAGVFVALIGLVALGIGTIIRHTAGAIATYVAAVFIVPLVINAFPASIRTAVEKFLPLDVGRSMGAVHPVTNALSPWASLGLLCGYAVVLLAVGCWLLVRRDA